MLLVRYLPSSPWEVGRKLEPLAIRNRSIFLSQVTQITALGRSQLGTDTRQRLLNFLMRISSTTFVSSIGTPSKEAVQLSTLI